ncbi:hypothetical protein COT51_02190 [candidate division WWE3 bacterium CG08_land_8_20_14_0_20_41_15]|uniref:Uncharacterized protein n=2 Tax=Katanobacteria TaxID=422282 RepID=A0A2H0X9E2_UNCKA|nr:MAG: hypothetical protein COT51_02190 [candidate division WWE3 bacterium CG08_land_8_20_14_0_20_41_15]
MDISFLTPLAIVAIVIFSVALSLRALKKKASPSNPAFDPESSSYDNVILLVKVPRDSGEEEELKTAPLAAEQMFSSLHGLLRITPEIQEHISFEVFSTGDTFSKGERGIFFYVTTPKSVRDFVESQIYAQYPDAQIDEVEDYLSTIKPGGTMTGAYISTEKEDFFPIKTFRDFEVDPLSAVTGAMSKVNNDGCIWIQYLLCPLADGWQDEGHQYVDIVREGKKKSTFSLSAFAGEVITGVVDLLASIPQAIINPPEQYSSGKPLVKDPLPPRLSAGKELALKSLENKLSKMGFRTVVRVGSCAGTKEKAENQLRSVIATFKQYSISDLNGFTGGIYPPSINEFVDECRERSLPKNHAFILSTEEIASIFHFPSSTVETPAISWTKAKHGEPPLNLPTSDCTFLGKTTFRNQLVKFGIKDCDRARHTYLIGKTGTGKSTLFKNMIYQDIINGKGVGVLDPHGNLIDELLELIPDNRIKDVVIFDPSDADRPVSLNMLECPDQAQKNLMASGLVDVFKKHFGYSWGPRLEYLLNNCILTLLEIPNTTLLGITRLLSDDNYQKYIVYQIKDPMMRDFWTKEFIAMKGNQKLITEAIAPIQNKVGRFLSSSTIRNIVGQAKSSIRIDEVMDQGKIFLVNLSKGRIGEDNANLLGSMIVSRIAFMAMQRVNLPEDQRKDFFLFVDEFQNFASGSFASILSEARKYHLCLHLTHQYTAQLPEEMMAAVSGNVGTIASFSLGAPDATILEPEFAPFFTENDLISLEMYHMYIKLMIDGQTSVPFSAVSLPPPDQNTGNKDKVMALSREVYGHDVAEVEDRIKGWIEKRFDLGQAIRDAHARGEVPREIPKITTVQPTVQEENAIEE